MRGDRLRLVLFRWLITRAGRARGTGVEWAATIILSGRVASLRNVTRRFVVVLPSSSPVNRPQKIRAAVAAFGGIGQQIEMRRQ